MIDIEYVVKNATNTWKIVYCLDKPSEFIVEVKDDDDDDKDEEGDERLTHFIIVDYEEYKEKDTIKEEKKDDEGLI